MLQQSCHNETTIPSGNGNLGDLMGLKRTRNEALRTSQDGSALPSAATAPAPPFVHPTAEKPSASRGSANRTGRNGRRNDKNDGKKNGLKEAFAVAPEDMIPIGDVIFDNVTMHEAVQRIVAMTKKTDRPRYVCTANLDHLALCERDDEFREIYRRADLVLADGMPVVWLSQPHVMGSLHARVAGSDLFFELARASAVHGLRLFLLGGSPGSAEKATEALQILYPGANICGSYCPSFEDFKTEAEQEKIAGLIKAAKPHVLFVGLGAPKQEKWIAKYKHVVNVPVSIGVGGSFEMAGGIVRRAPEWMQKSGLEWSYRLVQEPKRLWHRYVQRDMPYLLGMVPTAAKMAKFRVGSAIGNLKATPDISDEGNSNREP